MQATMASTTKIFVLIIISSAGIITGGPVGKSTMSQCYEHDCPRGTYSCKKHTLVSDDKKFLEVTISCLDDNRHELQSFNEQKPNPYEPNVKYEGYSYTFVYEFQRLIPANSIDFETETEKIIK